VINICLLSSKGGIGKSVIAISIANNLSQDGHKVVLIDADPSSNTTSHFIEDLEDIENKTLRQVLKKEVVIRDVIVPIKPNLDFIPAEIEMRAIERELALHSNTHYFLYERLSEIKDDYDYCIIDTQGDLGFLPLSAYIASEFVIMPTRLEKWSVRSIATILNIVEAENDTKKYIEKQFKGFLVVPTMFESRTLTQKHFINDIKKRYSDIMSKTVIHKAAEVEKTFAMDGSLLVDGTRTYDEYRQLTDEIKGVLNGKGN